MQSTPFTCSRCNAPLPPGVMQCPNCGLAFAAPVPPPASPGQMAPGYGMPPAKKSMSPLAIIGIIGAVGCLPVIIFAAILFPIFARARDRARITSSESNLKQIGLGVLQFSQDHNEKLPPTDSMDHFKAALGQYIVNPDGLLFVQPGANRPYLLNAQVSNQSIAGYAHPEAVVLAREAVPHPGGQRAVLYLDGHVSLLTDNGSEGSD